ncbi:DUF1810 domain-containing protein [Roseomonas haemaphysalidis]|uniref:DUF1810 domain-containing protein n=1 Tax=Roseomonas haemaphysalidis TaxID=2768162 RepID=A0ABS3KLQ4_9PROT|nr:DUF1810 domain-containing protein [Roseomonas haemaphysalidis]MBO1077885.1 DUF1810 domain-containing protein [Roseomonas haemaphysalidis]
MFDAQRFVAAQAPVIEDVRRELRAGQKRSHWMWFVFPQIAGLGHSDMARRYALHSLSEARAYLAHPVLGPRLVECTGLVNAVRGRTIRDVLGSPDDMKFRSCMSLFAALKSGEPVFDEALRQWFAGQGDPGGYPE